MNHKPIGAIIAVLIIGLTTSGLGEDASRKGLLREDLVFGGMDGKLTESQGRWLFVFDSPITDGKAELQAGQPLELLPSAMLEKMAADSKQRVDAYYRLWGKVTRYGDKNFVLAVYFLPLTKRPETTAQQTKRVETMINAPGDILNIPDSIAAQLQQRQAFETEQAGKPLELKADSILADRTGLIVAKDGDGYILELDGLGQGIQQTTFRLLPCQMLEQACREQASQPDKVRFKVAGIVTRYQGRDYLLLQRATCVYTHGNFTR